MPHNHGYRTYAVVNEIHVKPFTEQYRSHATEVNESSADRDHYSRVILLANNEKREESSPTDAIQNKEGSL